MAFERPESGIDIHDVGFASVAAALHVEDLLGYLVDQNAEPIIEACLLQHLRELGDHHLLELRVLGLVHSGVEVVGRPRLLDFKAKVLHFPLFLVGFKALVIVLLLIHYYRSIDNGF